jgi:hypothetical protein
MTCDSKRNPTLERFAAVFIVVLTFLAFLPALRAGWIWDDGDYVVNNPNLITAAGLGRIWTDAYSNWQFYPLVFTSFWAEFQAWGLRPFGYHFDNILIHAASALLLWRLLRRVGINDRASLLAAAIFAVHPVQVESVAWVSERKNVLCGLFYFAAMLAYLNVRDGNLVPPKSRLYLAAWLLFLFALFSKTVASTWPLAILVLTWWKNGRIRRRDVWALVPFFAAGLLLSAITAHLEKFQVGAQGKLWDFTLADRCIIAGRAVWFYVEKALLPIQLTFIYPKWDLNHDRAIQIAIAASAVVVLATLFFLSRRISRAPATAAFLFVVTLSPALGFVNFYPMRYSFVADHFQYLAIVALIVPAAVIAVHFFGRAAFVLVIPLAILSFRQCLIYQDERTLWADTVSKNYTSWMTHVSLGQQLEAADPAAAEREFKIAVAVEPSEADAWWRLGEFEGLHNHLAEAELCFRQALQDDPNHPGAIVGLRTVLSQEHKIEP